MVTSPDPSLIVCVVQDDPRGWLPISEYEPLLLQIEALEAKLSEIESLTLVKKGYLITHRDGFEVRLGLDRTRADLYAEQNFARIEPLYVQRKV